MPACLVLMHLSFTGRGAEVELMDGEHAEIKMSIREKGVEVLLSYQQGRSYDPGVRSHLGPEDPYEPGWDLHSSFPYGLPYGPQ